MDDISKLIEELREAESTYKEARRLEDIHRRDATAALNRLNDKQKAIKSAFERLIEAAPLDSDWKRAKAMKLAGITHSDWPQR
jgi:hypothetical protein